MAAEYRIQITRPGSLFSVVRDERIDEETLNAILWTLEDAEADDKASADIREIAEAESELELRYAFGDR